LGGKPASIKPALTDEGPKVSEDKLYEYHLFRVTDATGTLKTEEIKERPLTKKMLSD